MAKVVGVIKLKGTIDDLNFYNDQEGNNIARAKGGGISSKQFYENPIFQRIRDHGKEFGHAAVMSRTFRMLVRVLNEKAKDLTYAGRSNQLLLEIIKEDTLHENGERTLVQGIQEEDVASYLLGFEGNKHRPLGKVLLVPWLWNESVGQVEVAGFHPLQDLDWPAEATHVELCVGRTNWDFESTIFDTQYSPLLCLEKTSPLLDLHLAVEEAKGAGRSLLYFYIGFLKQQRKTIKPLKRIHNTVSLCKVFD